MGRFPQPSREEWVWIQAMAKPGRKRGKAAKAAVAGVDGAVAEENGGNVRREKATPSRKRMRNRQPMRFAGKKTS